MREAGGGGVRRGETVEKLACIGMEFSWPAGRELRAGWRVTDHPPLSDRHTHTHTPNQSRGEGAMGVGERSQTQRRCLQRSKGRRTEVMFHPHFPACS